MRNLENRIDTLNKQQNILRKYTPHILVSGAIAGSVIGAIAGKYFAGVHSYIVDIYGGLGGLMLGSVAASYIIDELGDEIKDELAIDHPTHDL